LSQKVPGGFFINHKSLIIMAKTSESKSENKAPHPGKGAVSESQASGIVDSIEKNRIILFGSVLGIFALIAGYLVLKQMASQRHIKAGQMFTEAAASKSIEGLDKVVIDFAGSIAAGNALLTKADLLINQSKSEDAMKVLNEVIKDFPDHPRYVQAFYMLANLYHKSGDFAKARENYAKVLEIQPDAELSPIATIRLGDIELSEGNAEKARQKYEESFTKFPGNAFFATAERRITQLKLGKPTEIERPKPPEEKKEAAVPAPATTTPEAAKGEKGKSEEKGKADAKGKAEEKGKADAKGKAEAKGSK
jgi:tetratricopeptide (TPR) repeat protein